ncbi:MAG: response regulator [Acidobacteriota bacterium]|nr:response regulator [Acidobacteriota bacterium]
MPLMVLALGAGSILLLLGNNWIQERWIAGDVGSLRAIEEIQTRMAIAHLWIEEFVTGDDVDLGEIEHSLNRGSELAATVALRTSDQSPATGSGPASIPELAAAAARRIDEFERLTLARQRDYAAGLEVGVGSPFDTAYDAAFADLGAHLGRLEQALILRLTNSERRARLLFRSVLLAWSLIIALAAAGLWSRERKQRQIELALGDSQTQLLQAQKMEAVGRLAGGLAHDINNYLAAIAAQSELAKMKAEPGGSTAKRMDAVLATTKRAGALIERLLAFSRRQPAKPESVDLHRILVDLHSMLTRLLGEDIDLHIESSPGLWPIEIDASQLEQIVLNLAVNAREAMPTGGSLTIGAFNQPAEKPQRGSDWVALRVVDTGAGIPEKIRHKIFEPFFSTKKEAHSGLGLATVLGIVEQNGGRVEVGSGEGGTTFEILLPRSSKEPSQPTLDDDAGSIPPAEGGSILLVEDNDELRRSTHDLLATWGYSVTPVRDGLAALETFEAQEEGFDLLITDVVMPGLNGREVAETLQDADPALPVLYISGHTDDVVLRHDLEAGSVDLLQKPFSAGQLAHRVRAALARVTDSPQAPN